MAPCGSVFHSSPPAHLRVIHGKHHDKYNPEQSDNTQRKMNQTQSHVTIVGDAGPICAMVCPCGNRTAYNFSSIPTDA